MINYLMQPFVKKENALYSKHTLNGILPITKILRFIFIFAAWFGPILLGSCVYKNFDDAQTKAAIFF
jgi:hypothetical protein